MKFKDYYKILGVDRDAKPEEIKLAYRRLARKFHPDVSQEAHAEEQFKEVQEAYEVLKDSEKRAAYDQIGTNFHAGEDFRPPPDWHFEFGGGEFADLKGFSDFFESLFGAHGARGRPGGAPFAGRGQDQFVKLRINVQEAYAGTTRHITLSGVEAGRDGGVKEKQRTLNVRIPAGVTNGQQIRLSGQGGPGFGQGPAGDLFLEVEIAPDPRYRVDGRDIYVDLPVTPWEAALGQKITADTLGGRVDVTIPPGSQTGKKLRLRGRGLPGQPAGDQFLVVKIVTPPADSEAARALYREMQRAMPYNPRAPQ